MQTHQIRHAKAREIPHCPTIYSIYKDAARKLIFDASHIDKEIVSIYLKYFRNSCREMIFKKQNLSSEIYFWERAFHEEQLRHRSAPEFCTPASRSRESIRFAITELRGAFGGPLRLLEVGSGPISQFYSEDIVGNLEFEICAVDPLADTYNELHRKYRSGYSIRCIGEYAEKLNRIFPPNHFHLVYSQNAIDHSASPMEFLENCYRATQPKGFLVLSGFMKVGTLSQWWGLHKWDIEFDGENLLLSNRDKSVNRKKLAENHDLEFIRSWVNYSTTDAEYSVVYRKKSEKE